MFVVLFLARKLCLHVTSAFTSTSNCVTRHEWIPWYQVGVFTLCVCLQRMGWEPILCMCVCVTIDSIQNFDADIDADAAANVTCKHSFTTNQLENLQNVESYFTLTEKILTMKSIHIGRTWRPNVPRWSSACSATSLFGREGAGTPIQSQQGGIPPSSPDGDGGGTWEQALGYPPPQKGHGTSGWKRYGMEMGCHPPLCTDTQTENITFHPLDAGGKKQ